MHDVLNRCGLCRSYFLNDIILTHWSLNKMAVILSMPFSYAFREWFKLFLSRSFWRTQSTHYNDVSNHKPHGCLLNRLFRHRSKKTSKLRVTGLGIHGWPVNSPYRRPVTRKMFPFASWENQLCLRWRLGSEQGPLLPAWFKINPSMDKQLHPL